MKKPHEQEWRDVGGPCGGRIVNDADEVLADEVTEEALPLILAAPDMARALMAIRERVSDAGKSQPREKDADQMAALEDSFVTIPTAMLRDAFAALRKAGVL